MSAIALLLLRQVPAEHVPLNPVPDNCVDERIDVHVEGVVPIKAGLPKVGCPLYLVRGHESTLMVLATSA